MINIVVTSKPVDGLLLYSYEYCTLLNESGVRARVVVVPHRLYTQQDYIDTIDSKYIHSKHLYFKYNDQFPITMVMGRSMVTQAYKNFDSYDNRSQKNLRELFSRKLISVYSSNHPHEYPKAIEFFNPQEIQDLCDTDVYPDGVGEHFEKHINFEIYKPHVDDVQFEYLFLGTNMIYYTVAARELPKYQDHGIITYDEHWVNHAYNNIFVPVENFLGIFNTYVYTKDHFDPAPRIIQECKKFGKEMIYKRSKDLKDGGYVYWRRLKKGNTKPDIQPIIKAFKNLMKIQPRCLAFLFNKSPKHGDNSKGAAYTSDGFMLPCCWLDDPPVHRWITAHGLKDEHLAVSNNEKLEDIYTSDEWENFFQTLLWSPENAPYMCKKKCGVNISSEKLKKEERREVEWQFNESNN